MAFSFDLAVISNWERRRMKRRSMGIRRRRRDICKSHEPTREIPFELVIEILTRLPAKSLMRFKSVSKLWSSLICSQDFTNRFLKVSASPPRLFMLLGVGNRHVLLSSSASPDSESTTMSPFVLDQDLTIPAMKGYYISDLFRGLMCFTNGPSARIYNTTTRQLVFLPDIGESNIIPKDDKNKKIMYQIGHDPVHDQYKVVCTVAWCVAGEVTTFLTEHWVLLLGGGDGSSRWRKIPSQCPPHLPLTQGLTINGRMHYLAWVQLLDPVLVSFDISSEEISMLQVPDDRAFVAPLSNELIECGGRVALLDHIDLEDNGVMKLWVMEDEEKNKWWSSKTLVLRPAQMNMLNSISLRVQGTTREGEVIFAPDNTTFVTRTGEPIYKPQNTTSFYVFIYNLQKNHLRKVEILESSNRCLTYEWDVIGYDDSENLVHL